MCECMIERQCVFLIVKWPLRTFMLKHHLVIFCNSITGSANSVSLVEKPQSCEGITSRLSTGFHAALVERAHLVWCMVYTLLVFSQDSSSASTFCLVMFTAFVIIYSWSVFTVWFLWLVFMLFPYLKDDIFSIALKLQNI